MCAERRKGRCRLVASANHHVIHCRRWNIVLVALSKQAHLVFLESVRVRSVHGWFAVADHFDVFFLRDIAHPTTT